MNEHLLLTFQISLMDFGPQQIGKLLIAIGATIILIGALFLLLGQLGFFKLPGDLNFGSKNWRVFFPITTCLIISILLTLIFWLISYLRR
jgi:hypothetical protein